MPHTLFWLADDGDPVSNFSSVLSLVAELAVSYKTSSTAWMESNSGKVPVSPGAVGAAWASEANAALTITRENTIFTRGVDYGHFVSTVSS